MGVLPPPVWTPDWPTPKAVDMFAYSSLTVLIATLAVASVSQANLVNHVRSLLSRQNESTGAGIDPGIIPPKCRDICAPINDLTSNVCTTPDCICGTRISSSMSGCLQCALDVSGLASLIPQAQKTYDDYVKLCSDVGKTVPSHTFKINGGTSNSGPGASGGPEPSGSPVSSPGPGVITVTVTNNPSPSPTPQVPNNPTPPLPTPSSIGTDSSGSSGSSGSDNSGGAGGVSSGCSQMPVASTGIIGALAAVLMLAA